MAATLPFGDLSHGAKEGSHERPRGSVYPKQAPNTVILYEARVA
jgi:hypothetical protein